MHYFTREFRMELKSHSDLIGELFDECLVERNLEKIFDVDNLGSSLNEDNSVIDYDNAMIREFENSIHYRNNAYSVNLPCHEDKIKTVPSDCPVALKVLEKANNHLESKNLLNNITMFFTNRRVEE